MVKKIKKITFKTPPIYIIETPIIKKIFSVPKTKRIIKK